MEKSDIKKKVLKEVMDFLKSSGLSEWQFGMRVAQNHKLIQGLRSDRPMLSTTIDKIRNFINASRL